MPEQNPIFEQAARLVREVQLDHSNEQAVDVLLATLVIQMSQLNALVQTLGNAGPVSPAPPQQNKK